MSNIWRFFIRSSSFLRKEIAEILRQPRLVLTLVLGPFLILLLFGIGYRSQPAEIRTLFVLDADSPFHNYLDEYTAQISSLLTFTGTSDSVVEAQAELRRDNVDLVVVLPEDPVQQIRDSQQAVFEIYHNELDPFQIDFMEAFARLYINEINERVLTSLAREGQVQSTPVQETVSTTRVTAGRMKEALQNGEARLANVYRDELIQRAGLVAVALGGTVELLGGVEEQFGTSSDSVQPVVEEMRAMQAELDALGRFDENQADFDEEIEQAERIEEEFGALEEALQEVNRIDPGVLVSPFTADVQTISGVEIDLSDFYVPAALALLAQHLSLTFAALSIVRERRQGAIEMFQVSPVSAIEVLLGKYISYFVFDFILLAVLTVLARVGLQAPFAGSWGSYALVIAALVSASLGMGFVLSLLAQTTSQAVQYSMIVLLASIFFSGFFLTLELLRPFVLVVSYILPATYATQLLQNVMLRGVFGQNEVTLLLILFGMGLVLFFLAWLLLRRTMARR